MQINWEHFPAYGQDEHGIHLKFEDLCRQLFIYENLSQNKQFRYLHANPNNYGLEAEPIYDETNQRWIGFQAKFFTKNVSYDQIRQSMEKVVEYYTGKDGTVDLVYLFCNKPINTNAKSYKGTLLLLKKSNIHLQLITDTAILDLVRNKYPQLGLYYFGNHSIKPEWFADHTKHMFDELGERYNRSFNVKTEFLDELSLFVHDQRAADYLNSKKEDLLKGIEKLHQSQSKHKDYLRTLRDVVSSLPDVNIETLNHSFEWENTTVSAVKVYIDTFTEEIKILETEWEKLYSLLYSDNHKKEECDEARKSLLNVESRIHEIDVLIELCDLVVISDREKELLCNDVMAISGEAGTGKSQLLACKTNSLLKENRAALLLVAGIYYTNDPIHEQIMKNLRQDYSFDDLVDILEVIGEKNNRIVPIFIDALNETWHEELWKSGLPYIIKKIRHAPMVKLVFSYRPEYEKSLLSETLIEEKKKGNIVTVNHRGFEYNSYSAVKEFLNYYNIPFTPLQFLRREMSNPLFLTLYCKTYNGEEVSLPELYERIIKKANDNIYTTLKLHSLGYTRGQNFLNSLVVQIAVKMVLDERRAISKKDLLRLSFWTEYKLVPAPLIRELEKEEILHEFINEDIEYYRFSFDQMNDYYCAKAILHIYNKVDDCRNYLSTHVLKIENGVLKNFRAIDLFVNACALLAEKYGAECIDIIDVLHDEEDRQNVFSRYLDSFQWRNDKYLSHKQFYDLLKKYPWIPEDLWTMLIGNSIKVSHPLNADFLHKFLLNYKLNERDYFWTIHINKLTIDEENRLVQLIEIYRKGEKLNNMNEKQSELLLTLFGWILSSSNRWLRDCTSKAMIEILKENFQLCLPILEKFKDVDDPYIIQRLYGLVFGACCKRTLEDNNECYRNLAEYVYRTVFDQETVYPDILLRDYARLIIERFLYENHDYNGVIKQKKITPPYASEPIPEIEDQHYEDKKYGGAISLLIRSMQLDSMGGYGDFGRYVFQRALQSFDVDEKKMFNYAIHYILNELGFDEDYFGENDRHYGSYGRHRKAKTERIGKKYQWIAMYNILARVSDQCKKIDRWNYPPNEDAQFEGAWDPYVRDFDPTLNVDSMCCEGAPAFNILEEHVERGKKENEESDISTAQAERDWLETQGFFLNGLKDTLILADDNGEQWICLTKYCNTARKDLDIEKLQVWSWLYAYFVTSEQATVIAKCAETGSSLITSEIGSPHETYTIFNREYPWSPSCRKFEEYAWVDAQIKTGEFETITEKEMVSDFSAFEALSQKYLGEDEDLCDKAEDNAEEGFSDDYIFSKVQPKEVIEKREIEKEIGKILHSTTHLIWEEEFDASKEGAISMSMPCGKLIEEMKLKLMTTEGFYYDHEGKLAAFDTNLIQRVNSVVVRKDILDLFLTKLDMKLIWFVGAGKEIYKSDYTRENWSDWEAVFVYEGDKITGEIHRIQET